MSPEGTSGTANTIGKGVTIKGELRTTEDITFEGRIEGHIFCESCAVVFGPTSEVTGDVIGEDVIVCGRFQGQIVATDVVDIREGADVRAQVISRRFILDAAAKFGGRVEPQHLEAALRVAHFQQRKREAGARA